jgi:hypothetical protein
MIATLSDSRSHEEAFSPSAFAHILHVELGLDLVLVLPIKWRGFNIQVNRQLVEMAKEFRGTLRIYGAMGR